MFAANEHRAPRAGGVSPPWFGNRACKGDSAHVHHDRRTDNQERGASAPRGLRKRACNDDPPIRGRLPTPHPRTSLQSQQPESRRAYCGLRFSLHVRRRATAGSRPPLLCTCVCTSRMALYAVQANARRAPGAVGVSRPWKTSAIARALAIPRRAHARRSSVHRCVERRDSERACFSSVAMCGPARSADPA
jgi:hypothetical protein